MKKFTDKCVENLKKTVTHSLILHIEKSINQKLKI